MERNRPRYYTKVAGWCAAWRRTTTMNLTDKAGLVTGASRGIGRACAIKLAALGARVAVNFNTRADAADDVVAAIKAAGGEAFAVQGDVSQLAAAQGVVGAVTRTYGRLDFLVNNAGTTRAARSRR